MYTSHALARLISDGRDPEVSSHTHRHRKPPLPRTGAAVNGMALSVEDLSGCSVVLAARAPRPLSEFLPVKARRSRQQFADDVAGVAGVAGAVPLKRLRPCAGLTTASLPTDDAMSDGGSAVGVLTSPCSRPSSIQRDASFPRSLGSSATLPRLNSSMRSPSRASSSLSECLNLEDEEHEQVAACSSGPSPDRTFYRYIVTV